MVDPLWGSTAEAIRELLAQKVLSTTHHNTPQYTHHNITLACRGAPKCRS